MIKKPFHKQKTLPDLMTGTQGTPSIPEMVGPYKIESLLNQGGMSLLYLGIDPQLKKPLAIKVLSPEYVTHPELAHHFLKEAQIIELASHPNIVKLYGQGEWEKGLYIAMELIQGVSLRQFIIQHSLSIKRSLEIILQVAYALCHLHTHGIIHRDLKPENILITEDGEINVIDFGISQLHEENKKQKLAPNNSLVGTPSYMSPEQKEDSHSASFASDIYALGVIAYELILGKLSFGIIDLSLLPKGLRKILEKALASSVKERYQDVVEFITDITHYLESEELQKEKPGSDQIKELLESLQKATQSLSPVLAPSWPQVEIGIAKYKALSPQALYYDFFKLPNNAYAIFLAEAISTSISSGIALSSLRGMIRTLVQQATHFHLLPFARTLNELVAHDPISERFKLSILILDPTKEELAFIAFGMGPLFQLSKGNRQPHKLASHNPLLGADPQREILVTTNNWSPGDTLVLHSIETEQEEPLIHAITEHSLLSPQRSAEAIIKKLSYSPHFPKTPELLMTLSRLA
jgi:serine/threonine protein kinase